MNDITKTGRRVLISLDAVALILIAISSAAGLYAVTKATGIGKFSGFGSSFDNCCIAIELVAFMVTAAGLIGYIRTGKEQMLKAMYVVMALGLAFGYMFWIYNGVVYDDMNFEGTLILGTPNLLALAAGIVLLLPSGTKKTKRIKYVMATVNTAFLTIACVGVMAIRGESMIYSGYDRIDVMESMAFIGVPILFIVIAVIELTAGRQYQKSSDIK